MFCDCAKRIPTRASSLRPRKRRKCTKNPFGIRRTWRTIASRVLARSRGGSPRRWPRMCGSEPVWRDVCGLRLRGSGAMNLRHILGSALKALLRCAQGAPLQGSFERFIAASPTVSRLPIRSQSRFSRKRGDVERQMKNDFPPFGLTVSSRTKHQLVQSQVTCTSASV